MSKSTPERPGFPIREAHAHLAQLGRSLSMVDLTSCVSADEAVARLAQASADARLRADGRRWVLAQGARPESWPDARWPSRETLDKATPDVCALIWCFDYHAMMVNSATLALAGIDERTRDPIGGIIDRDASQEPTGVLLEAAALNAWRLVPEPAHGDGYPEDYYASLELRNLGFSEVHDLKSAPGLGPSLRWLRERDEFVELRAVLFPLLEDLDEALASRRDWECDEIRLGGAKIFVDGTLNSRTAWMLHPFADGRPDHPSGTPMMTPKQIEDAIRRCDDAGLPLAAHAIGDGAVRAVLDAIEKVRPITPGFRIEHAEVIDETDVRRFADLGVIASVQPCHLLVDIEALGAAIPDRLDRVLPLRELIDAGLEPGKTLLFGSDVPIVRADPEDSILAATMRRRIDMDPRDAIAPAHALDKAEAWKCFAC